ncbi:MAG: ring-cleaving dioxygenase [Bacteroidota bacterium]|nr:ring-cleaving dioxygenase [Bacteroidota bacterium]
MKNKILGIHHITAMASDAQRNVDFYVLVLGLRFVKKSINQDAPDVYHLYYGDEVGSPGTAMTFFPFGRASRGTRGNGEISRVGFSVPTISKDFWINHLSKKGISFSGPERKFENDIMTFLDPDGMMIELVFSDKQILKFPWKQGPIPVEHAIRNFFGVTMNLASLEASATVLNDVLGFHSVSQNGNTHRFLVGEGSDEAAIDIIVNPNIPFARQSAGSVHHIAWRAKDFVAHEEWQRFVEQGGLSPTEVIDRFYFHSIYFREPGGVLYEIASDNPGFTVDEPLDQLGTHLMLPPWYEIHREKIERTLPPISIPTFNEILK